MVFYSKQVCNSQPSGTFMKDLPTLSWCSLVILVDFTVQSSCSRLQLWVSIARSGFKPSSRSMSPYASHASTPLHQMRLTQLPIRPELRDQKRWRTRGSVASFAILGPRRSRINIRFLQLSVVKSRISAKKIETTDWGQKLYHASRTRWISAPSLACRLTSPSWSSFCYLSNKQYSFSIIGRVHCITWKMGSVAVTSLVAVRSNARSFVSSPKCQTI